ncbi:MAG TPA: AMP-binding protein, partial [Acidimicrobiia bacterium]|nr:AMP-binding protein [Acidimicrobiia bacterium]
MTTVTGARSLWELIERRAELSPDHPMLIDEADRTLTFGAYRDRAARVAAGLAAQGVGEGTPVSWQLPTRIDTIVLSGALCRLGAVQNPIIHLYRDREVGFALRQTGARRFFIPGELKGFDYRELAARVTDGMDDPPAIDVVDEGLPEGDPSGLPAASAPGANPPVRWIYYTSGSTADP